MRRDGMRLTYFAHSAFLVEARDGTKTIIDPYLSGSYDNALRYAPIDESADVVLATHEHDDHAAASTIAGKPRVFMHPTKETVNGVSITGVQVAHDEAGGSKRGKNTIIILDDGDVRLVHLGDVGHILDAATIEAIGRVDVLLVPVGGFFTIDHTEAATVIDSLQPRIVLPMHYKTDKTDFPISTVEPFLATQTNVVRESTSTFEVTQATLPAERTVLVLEHAR
jgi:L-ascorbate metabolism protein UlaG (beta-lactamase superfamily)